MGLSFTISSITFGPLVGSNGRFALSFDAEAAEYDLVRYHLPGVDGTLVSRGGLLFIPIKCRVRYVQPTAAGVFSAFETDKGLWENIGINITGPGGTTWQRCELQSATLDRNPVATGRAAGQAFADAALVFHSLGGKQ